MSIISFFKRARVAPATKTGRTFVIGGRSFAAAEVDRLLSGWKWDGGFAPCDLSSQLATLRARSREMQKNSPHFRRWLQMVAINIVGDCFNFKSTPHDLRPNGKRELDKQAAAFIECHYWRWMTHRDRKTQRTYCDATGRRTIPEMDRMHAKQWARDGEYFKIPVVADNPYGIAFRSLRADVCDERYNVGTLQNGNEVVCGVERKPSTGEVVAYYFKSETCDHSIMTGYGTHLVRVPADRVIHCFTPEEDCQPRGVPWAHAVLCKLKMLEEYDKAELTAARDEACAHKEYTAKPGTEDGVFDLTDPDSQTAASARTALQQPVEAGEARILPPGWESKIVVPQHPNREVTAFKVSMLRDIAAGLGVEYANWANDWSGVSFSSVRQGTIGERDGYKVGQSDMIAQDKDREFLFWLESFLSLSISGAYPIEKFDKFAEHEFRGRRWTWVDPMKDISASEAAVRNGWKTNTQIAAEMDGDYEANVEELKREQAMLAGDKGAAIPVLNGAQITAALEIISKYATGQIGKDAAIGLLTAAGVPQETAQNMIAKQAVKEIANNEE